MATTLDITATLLVQKDPQTVFAYIADLRLDKNWRKEIKETVYTNPGPALGNMAIEESYLSKKVPAYKAALQCITYTPGKSIVYQSLPENAFYLQNTRRVEEISGQATKITYKLTFDVALVKYAIGFTLPNFLIKFYTQKTMRVYLQKLKHILETQS